MRTLFCIPGGGASSVMYLGWKKKLEGAFEVVPLEIPGRGRAAGAAQLETVEEVAEVLAAEIRRTARGQGVRLVRILLRRRYRL